MFAVILFTLYFVLFVFIIHYIVKKKLFHFSFWQTGAIFSFKVSLGCLYGYLFLKYYGGDDTWNFFNDSVQEYSKLGQNPHLFFADLLPPASFQMAHGFLKGLGPYLSDLEYWLMTRMLALFNIFSRGNYYIDTLFFEFLTCWGSFYLFKLVRSHFPDKKNVLFIIIFFIPSISFWLSGIRAEGLLLLFTSLALYYTGKWAARRKMRYLLIILACFCGLLILRVQFLLILIPAYICCCAGWTGIGRPFRYFIILYGAAICIFFGSLILFPGSNLSRPVIQQQQAFFALHGNTRFKLDSLEPSAGSFIRVLPQAILNSFFRPFIWEAKGWLQRLASIENMIGWIILIFIFIWPEKDIRRRFNDPLLLLFLFYGLSQIILIGYIVPFPGAIVRYKAIPELLLAIAAGVFTDWKKIINYNNK